MGTLLYTPSLYTLLCVYLVCIEEVKSQRKLSKMPKGSGLTKPLKLSPELAVICDAKKGENLARPEVVKRLWAYIKKNKLQIADNKQYFTPDEKMKPIFGEEKIRAFGMAKYLKEHLTNLLEALPSTQFIHSHFIHVSALHSQESYK